MKQGGTGLVVLVLCVLGGLIATVFTPAIAATLATPAVTASASPVARATPTRPVPTTAAPTKQPTTPVPTAQPTMPANVVTLARDTFHRNDQNGWGTASDNQVWNGDAANSPDFAIRNDVGQIAPLLTEQPGTLQATLGNQSNDAELLVSGSVTQFDTGGNTNLGIVLRWQDSNNWYKALIDGAHIQLLKDVNGTITTLDKQAFPANNNTRYNLRFRAQGGNLFARAWPNNQPEPAAWSVMSTDPQFTSGLSGIRVKIQPGIRINIYTYLETSVPNM